MNKSWTPEAIRALGATTDLPTLGSVFGLSRWRSYEMAHTGEWEQAGIHIIRMGSRYRVTVRSILAVLNEDSTTETTANGHETSHSGQTQASAKAANGTTFETSSQATAGGNR